MEEIQAKEVSAEARIRLYQTKKYKQCIQCKEPLLNRKNPCNFCGYVVDN